MPVLTIETICPDFQEWPYSWKGEDKDVPFGEGLIEAFRPFIQSLINAGWTKKTIRGILEEWGSPTFYPFFGWPSSSLTR